MFWVHEILRPVLCQRFGSCVISAPHSRGRAGRRLRERLRRLQRSVQLALRTIVWPQPCAAILSDSFLSRPSDVLMRAFRVRAGSRVRRRLCCSRDLQELLSTANSELPRSSILLISRSCAEFGSTMKNACFTSSSRSATRCRPQKGH